jgi:eukaryotic-like serine/threonine-protein kinase
MTRALGRYELLRPLARGGMAEVYLARRRAAGVEKWLVVKRMRPETSGDPRFLELFVREARLSMSLVHQNIVPVFDFGKIDDQVFLAMERVEGKDLGSSLARATTHRLPPLLAAFVAAECCQALDYAHQRKSPDGVALGVVHRDVTPRNVLLSWSGEVKLTDFGIAALAGDATSRLLGTPQYMAPEQARSEPIDPRTDLYAIGLVLREAVSGTRPRPGADREAILDAARRGELLPWSHLAAAAPDPASPPAELIAIIDRATAARPGDRYPDARSMLEDLDSFIVGQRAAHKAESPARQLAAWLATIWEGARDDVETEATIEGKHLLSFIDDGAFDKLGTGTVRSLAATAADDGPAAPAAPGVFAPAPASSAAAPPPAAGAAVAPARSSEPGPRSTKISSSNTTVASGSFHTIPASGPNAAPGKPAGAVTRRPASRQVPALAGIVFVGVAVGAVVFFVTNSYRDRDRPITGQPSVARLDAAPPDAAPPDAAQPDAAPPDAAQADTGQPHTRSPGTGQPHTGQPSIPRSGSGQPSPGAGHGGSGSAATAPPSGSDRARPAACRVRINFAPWAYFAADGDSTRHETPSTIELTPGPHRIHVWNPELHVERDITINVPADRDTMNFSEPLQPTTLPPDPGPSAQP